MHDLMWFTKTTVLDLIFTKTCFRCANICFSDSSETEATMSTSADGKNYNIM